MVRDVIWLSHWGAVNAGKHPEGGESKWARERCFETEHRAQYLQPPHTLTHTHIRCGEARSG